MVDFAKEGALLREAKRYAQRVLGEAFISPVSHTSDVSGADASNLIQEAYKTAHRKAYRDIKRTTAEAFERGRLHGLEQARRKLL